ncbi:MAG: hypothetical protein V2A54_04080 [Bacteroidota bacterium]
MKTRIFLTMAAFMISIALVSAQSANMNNNNNAQNKKEKIEAQKVAFITSQLDMTPKESQDFWPVYNQFKAEREVIMKSKKANGPNAKTPIDQLSDKELEKLADNELIYEQQLLDLKKKYHSEFKKVLPMKKLVKFYQSEKQFNKELLKKMKGPKNQPGQNQNPR